MLRTAVLDIPLTGLEELITEAAPALGGAVEALSATERDVEIVGPFPVFTAPARSFADNGGAALEPAGWRALACLGDRPAMVVDIFLEGDDGPRFGLRGEEAATALDDALAVAAQFADQPLTYEVRWMTLPDLYITGLWLSSEIPVFIPTRTGGETRARARPVTETQMRSLVRRLLANVDAASTAQEGAALMEGLGGDAVEAGMPGSRSGPAD